MASPSFIFLLLLSLFFTIFPTSAVNTTASNTTTIATLSSSSSSLSHLPPPPPPSPTHTQETQQQLPFNSIIDAIIGAGDFNNWANLLAEADPSILPLTATLFIPDDAAFTTGTSPPSASSVNFIDPLLFTYHIIPRRFTFSELCLFPTGARLPTLLPGNTLLITNNSGGNFSVSGATITRPDLFRSSVVSVHGVGGVLDYTLFGKDASSTPENSTDAVNSSPPMSDVSTSVANRKVVSTCCLVGVIVLFYLGIVGFDYGYVYDTAIEDQSVCDEVLKMPKALGIDIHYCLAPILFRFYVDFGFLFTLFVLLFLGL